MEKPIRVVELFAGVGGFRLGLEQVSSRFQTVWANQWEPSMKTQFAYECYVKHFGAKKEHVCADIKNAKSQIPPHDLLVGGFPCQDYSIAKRNPQGIEGKKGILWWEIDSILYEHCPSYVLLENVDRLIVSPAWQRGRDFSIILRCFYEKGYAVEWRVINAADYGFPQRRRRTFIFAYHNDTQLFRNAADDICIRGLKGAHRQVTRDGFFAPIFPLSSHGQTYTEGWLDEFAFFDMQELSDSQRSRFYNTGLMVNGRYYSVEGIPARRAPTSIGCIIEDGVIDEQYYLTESTMPRWRYVKGAKQELRHRKDGTRYIFSEGAVPFPDPLDRPGRTMLTSEGSLNRSSHVILDPTSNRLRTLTPIECERLNGFPDNWTAGMPDRMRYFTMGNALVVPIISDIGKHILQFTLR